jgi:tetratricopeptide (TPR) repeat protein
MSACCLFLLLLAGPATATAAAPPGDHLAAARRARAAGDAGETRRLYEEVLKDDPRNPELALEFAEALLDTNDAATAGRVLAILVAAQPDRPGPRRALARALLALGKPDEAVEHARRAARLDPKNLEGTTLLGFALVAANRPGEAVASFRLVLAAHPHDRDAHGGLAMAYAALGDPRAEKEFQTVLAAAPEARYFWQYADYLWRSHETERGNLQMEKALAAAPGDPRLLAAFGVELLDQGRFEDAARRLREAREAGNTSPALLTQLGSAEIENSRFDEAERILREAVAAAPDEASARHRLGVLLILVGKPEAARAELVRATELDKNAALSWLDLGRAEEAAGNLDAAEAAYRRALEIQPDLSRALYLLGLLLSRGDRKDEGREKMALYQAAYEKEQSRRQVETSRRAGINLGWVELRQKRFRKALSLFERYPDEAEALRGAAEALSALGRRREALAALERAFVRAPEDRGIAWRLLEERRKGKS